MTSADLLLLAQDKMVASVMNTVARLLDAARVRGEGKGTPALFGDRLVNLGILEAVDRAVCG